MKMSALPLALVFATAALAAAQAPAPEAAKPAESKATEAPKPAPAAKTHKVEAVIVTADVENKSVTFKTASGETTAPVGVLATYRLKKVKAGDKVTLTCKDGATPEECTEVTFIKVPEIPAAAPEAPKQ